MKDDDLELAAMAARVGDRLIARGESLVTAESCTGGWIAKTVTDVAGSSAWFQGALVTYNNALKRNLLAVTQAALADEGAVSETVVRQMAAGARRVGDADWAIAVSGVAGPDGGSDEKPVGLVWFGFAGPSRVWVSRQHFTGDREAVRRAAVRHALTALEAALAGKG